MRERKFGATDLKTSVIGFGTWPIGGSRYGRSDDRDAVAAIQAALDAGVTCFDTAPSYGDGHAEDLLGRALTGRRDEVTLVTKGGLVWNERSEVLGQDGSHEHLTSVLDASLRRLRTDRIDVFLIHWPDTATRAEQTATSLRGLVRSGKVRHVGVSNYTGDQLRQLAGEMGDIPLTTNQVSYHLFDQRWARDSFITCADLGIGTMAYGTLAHGLLAGAFTRDMVFDTSDWRSSGSIFGQPLLTSEHRDRNLDVVERLREIAGDIGTTLPRLALAWVLMNPVVTLALVGARTAAESEEAARAADLSLDPATMNAIGEVMAGAAGLRTALSA